MSRPKVDYRTASKEAYDKFTENNPSVTLSFEEFKKIIYTYNGLLVIYMLETGDAIKMPYGLGELVVNKYKPKRFVIDKTGVERVNLPVDWQESRKQGKKVFLLNHHTEGYQFYWMWNWWKSRIKDADIWKFEMARVNSRLLKTYVTDSKGNYKDIYRQYKRKR